MIIRMKILDVNHKEYTFLFGSSYKTYLEQIQDFSYRTQVWIDSLPHPAYSILSIQVSKSKWKSWGGLKWCLEENFQEELNREGVQSNEPDNPNPRQYSEMMFIKEYYHSAKIEDWYNRQYQERETVKSKNL